MTLNEFNWFVFGLFIGYAWYIVWHTIKLIWRNAREATARDNQKDPYQDPQNWGA
jgi:hypothetical protein